MWAGGPPNPMQPRRTPLPGDGAERHRRRRPRRAPPSSPLTGLVAQDLVGQLTRSCRLAASSDFRRPWPWPHRNGGPARQRSAGSGSEEPLGLHLVQGGIQGARADPVAVVGQLRFAIHAPWTSPVGGVVEDVQPHRPSQELVDYRIRYLTSISLFVISSSGDATASTASVPSSSGSISASPGTRANRLAVRELAADLVGKGRPDLEAVVAVLSGMTEAAINRTDSHRPTRPRSEVKRPRTRWFSRSAT